jgi:hypothetical protein
MAEWWLIDEKAQNAIASHIDSAAESVVRRFDNHGNENSLTAALGQELMRQPLRFGDTEVEFDYRNFLEQNEEPVTGADGGIVVNIRTREQTIKKGVLFQAKRLPQRRPVKSLTMPHDESRRLRRQIEGMLSITDDCVVVAHTRADIYVVDGESLDDLPIDELRAFPAESRLVTVGTYLGKWVPRCTKGDLNPNLVQRIENPRGFLNHLLTVDVRTSQTPLLTEGGIQVDPLTYRPEIPKPRWRHN